MVSQEMSKKAFILYKLSADQGCEFAQHNLALMYRAGEGTPVDLKEAFHLFEKSAEEGCTESLVSLGQMYYNGEEVNPNKKKSC